MFRIIMAYQLSSYARTHELYIYHYIFEFIEKPYPYEKFAIQARGSKQQYMAYNQKNMVENLLPNECKAII